MSFKKTADTLSKGARTLERDFYTSSQILNDEYKKIFQSQWICAGRAEELTAVGQYKTISLGNESVIILKDEKKTIKAHYNVCRHRGSRVCEEGSGEKRNFICPYHAWTYNHEGKLIGLYGEKTFGDINKEDFGLIELQCVERSGLVWVMLDPEETFNIDSWLGDFAPELETLNLTDWHIHEQREIEGPGWKVALDGYLEAYHHNQLHGDTVGKHTVGNLLVLDTYGPHQRLTFGRKTLKDLIDKPESEWDTPEANIRLIHSGFPNLSISGVLGDHCLVSQIFPTSSPNRTITRQTILAAKKPETDQELEKTNEFSEMVRQAVVDEDYKMGLEIQSNISNMGSYDFVYGKNEPAVQNYHAWITTFMSKDGSEW